jgi:Zn-dependent protease with chaperone function
MANLAAKASLNLLNHSNAPVYPITLCLTYLFGCIVIYFPMCRQQELEADSKAAKVLGNIDGGMGILRIFRKQEIAVVKDLNRINIFGPIVLFLNKILQPFATHPKTKIRIQELEKIKV